ncbi:response regulator [Pseudomonas sp. CCI3.2]|uniref:response regulator n=1 Tax=unclassified Pseudomonas TaxID=196821 RepID=UPI002AC8DD20|nr:MULTISPECIES: response regulator [unclassified Pseudomonas]MEB0078554.1 response regulator [Pseudomonas sp. MH10out]MEB0092146.1 response regulator [Pseudomonas sp. CCI4.2]MEB0100369.1 response regulator [Pseudomonas sp. CCI3.2]MEB0132816.1 response regulator [Pseudomonas sp. CCI2.4]MEB0159121.1 response regulator [Pseudomonas sp. AH2 (2023)]
MLAYSKKSFLIADDFSDFRSSVRSMLRELGVVEVDTADTGEQALLMCAHKRYDFILHDFNFGDGKKNGQQVLEDLMVDKLMSHESVFIMVTAENSQAMVMSALEWEPDAYLTKPFNRAGLAQRLEKLDQRKTLLKPILQALDHNKPLEVLAACAKLTEQDQRFAPLCLRYKANALRDLNQHDALESFLKGVLADRATPWAYAGLGKLLFKRGKVVEAQAIYERAIIAFPMMPTLYDGLADVLVAQGEVKRAQGVLESAVRLSPLAVRRQRLLGKLALGNEDFEGASKAYRHAVSQGKYSRFKDPESNLGLAQALINKNGDNGLDARSRVEVNQTLGEVAKEYGSNQGLQLRTGLMKATSLKRSDPEAAAKLTLEALAHLEGMDHFFGAEAALLVASQLQQLGHPDAGAGILKSCAEIYGDDPAIMQGIGRLTDDPAILGAGKAASDLNLQGVRQYKAGNIAEAQAFFRQALALQSKNISIALNMVQSLLHAKGMPADAEGLEECRVCLKMIGMMPETDPRYERYQKLQSRAFGA